ncbi:toll/interleukin-1 receptor domain-containing protein [Brevundimonas vesicularis]|uniref:toll/interleukin-1 receptor domain-containing protein n=1 Tax=Brevundimonas vesicularis TaxID=41276 RepID=UPI0028AEDE10|nr:toll/interleukin-1 receptor domain-containing protein [Brevundimonas vesicularis]
MKIFISHQKVDALVAAQVARRLLAVHGITSYLDVIDPYVNDSAENLAEHIRSEMGKCTQLLAVVSHATLASQWVPWEIGVATEKNFPLATYTGTYTPPPEFLRKWPYLKNDSDLDAYARASFGARNFRESYKKYSADSAAGGRAATSYFFTELRRNIGQ